VVSDASTAQIIASALGGGIVVGLLNLGVRLSEFRREDRARWATDRRLAWASLLDSANHSLAECAPLAVIARSAYESDDHELRTRAKNIATASYEHWLEAQPHIATLRLLAQRATLPVLAELESRLMDVVREVFAISITGTYSDDYDDGALERVVAQATQAVDDATEAARHDISA
jgi:hypothetical protein